MTDFRGGMEVQRQKTLEAISNLDCGYYYEQYAKQYEKIPGSPVAYWASRYVFNAFVNGKSIGDMGIVRNGMKTGNNDRFIRLWWEISEIKMCVNALNSKDASESGAKWFPYNKGGSFRKWYGNNEWLINWEKQGAEVIGLAKQEKRNVQDYPDNMKFLPAVTWSLITSSKPSFRYKQFHISDIAGMSLYAECNIINDAIALLNSKVTNSLLGLLAPTLNYQAGDIARIPYIEPKVSVVQLVKKQICISKKDWDSFETSWDFQCHPLIPHIRGVWNTDEMKNGTDNLPQRLYIEACFDTWQEECDNRFAQLKANEEELNRIFIDIYGLQDELTPEVEDKDVTVRKADLGRDIRSFISYAVGCMFGRYSIYEDGLMYAGGEWDYNKYEDAAWRADGKPETLEFYQNTYFMPDEDNIIPITDEEYFCDDIVGRFVEFVETVYGKDTLEENLDFIAQALGNKGNSSREVIRNYFIKDFYKDHLKVYQKRPIYWLFDSGKQNGFKALIYMHRYDADTVGRVRTDYLHRAQNYVETAMKSAEYTIENTTVSSEKSKAMKAVSKYTKQLAEMQTYDQAIAHVANQRIEIDLDDGVKVNYAKFQGVEVAQEGKRALKVDLLAKI